MDEKQPPVGIRDRREQCLHTVSGAFQRLGHRGLSRVAFLHEISRQLFSSAICDRVEIRLTDEQLAYRWRCRSDQADAYQYDVKPSVIGVEPPIIWPGDDPDLEAIIASMPPRDTTSIPAKIESDNVLVLDPQKAGNSIDQLHRVVAALDLNDGARGVIILGIREAGGIDAELREALGQLARLLSASIANRRSQFRLRERIKELTCLFGISQIVQGLDRPLAETLERIVALVPDAWQFPEIAGARIRVDDIECGRGDQSAARHVQSASIFVDGRDAGLVEVFYTGERPEFAEGPFLVEERSLIENIAREIAQHVERIEATTARRKLEEQLLHSDRLATIGQLAAGVAHEINEPLANILGFAQLIQKAKDLPNQVWRDSQQIVDAALHGREVVQNLLLFARQSPTTMKRIDLNRIVRESATMVAKRCEEKQVAVTLDLPDGCAALTADPARMKQMVINLMVNAIQAMPSGGNLRVETRTDETWVALVVIDEGVGMSDDVRRRLFEPFFTTKDVHEGTGLGLSVVHGIVTSHGGEIRVESAPDRGARFDIRLPVCQPAETDAE